MRSATPEPPSSVRGAARSSLAFSIAAALLFGAWAERAGSAREATGAVHATLGFVALLGVVLLASGLLLPSIVERYLGDVACPTPWELANLRSAAFSGGGVCPAQAFASSFLGKKFLFTSV